VKSALPEYDNPPVVEVVISLQFKPLEHLRAAHFGVFWQSLKSEGFSKVEDHGELAPAIETYETPSATPIGIVLRSFDDAPPLPRVWFLDEEQNQLVQLQRDRLVVNWRKPDKLATYPHYSQIIKRFKFALTALHNFVESEQLGVIAPVQCEITYINHVQASADAFRTVTVWTNEYSDDYLSDPEDVAFSIRYRMNDEAGKTLGRLHVAFQPAFQRSDRQPLVLLQLTARGKPEPEDSEGIFQLFDHQHEWIVRGFTSLTTEKMHKEWRRSK
jgi:uncharacterized protein (TIGR04255 family)